MIARLKGTLVERTPQVLVIDVQGVGYEIFASLETYQQLPSVGQPAPLHIHTHVREDEIILFGFLELREKHLFKRLIRVNGVGPRLALNILSGISTDQLLEALRTEDMIRMTAMPGVGKKTAQRLILDLKDKIIEMQSHGDSATPQGTYPLHQDLISVLVNLGYKRPKAEQALRQLRFEPDTTLQDAVRETLKHLGNGPH